MGICQSCFFRLRSLPPAPLTPVATAVAATGAFSAFAAFYGWGDGESQCDKNQYCRNDVDYNGYGDNQRACDGNSAGIVPALCVSAGDLPCPVLKGRQAAETFLNFSNAELLLKFSKLVTEPNVCSDSIRSLLNSSWLSFLIILIRMMIWMLSIIALSWIIIYNLYRRSI